MSSCIPLTGSRGVSGSRLFPLAIMVNHGAISGLFHKLGEPSCRTFADFASCRAGRR